MARINVTQLKHACLDPAWLRQWLADPATPVPPPATPAGQFPVNGALFHQLAAAFSSWLTDRDHHSRTNRLQHRDQLWHFLWEQHAKSRILPLMKSQSPYAAARLAEALKNWCQRLADLRASLSNFQSWRSAIITHEFDLVDVPLPTRHGSVLVSGRPDCVRLDSQHDLLVVDYKLSRGGNAMQDLLQLAIYSRLLRLSKPGLAFAGTLEYYEPRLHTLPQTEAQLNAIFTHLVQPVLRQIASASALPLHVPPSDTPAPILAASWTPSPEPDLSDAIHAAYQSFQIAVDVIDRLDAPQLTRYHLKPGAGVSFSKLRLNAVNLKIHLGLRHEPMITPGAGYAVFDVIKDQPDTVLWRDAVQRPEIASHDSPLALPLGIDIQNRLVIADLADSNTAHALVGGSSGSGKSELLKCLVATLIRRNTPQTLRLTLIDPKRLTFGGIAGHPYLTGPVLHDIEDALTCLDEAVEDMEHRYEILLRESHTRLSERIASGKTDIPFRVIVFDEFADLINSGKEEKKDFERLIKRLSAKGRAAGVHLIIATQRPDREVVTGQLKANLPLKICLRVTNATNSQILLDEPGAELLLGRGDLLCQRGAHPERAQSLYLPQPDFLDLFTPSSQPQQPTASKKTQAEPSYDFLTE